MTYIIDRFEGTFAIIETENGYLDLPRQLLPKDAQEGDVLRIEIDREKTASRRRRIQSLMDDLFED